VSVEQIIQIATTLGMAGGAFWAGWSRNGAKSDKTVETCVSRLEGKVDAINDMVKEMHSTVAVVEENVSKLPEIEKRLSDANERLTHVERFKAHLEDLGY
jgi:predicted nuclease with TOPRIM domain